MHTYTHTHTHTYTHAYIHAYLYAYTHACTGEENNKKTKWKKLSVVLYIFVQIYKLQFGADKMRSCLMQ